MAEYRTPGVYIEEIPHLPPSIASVETAIPAFIGFTQTAKWKTENDLNMRPWRITSMLEYEQYFGLAQPETDSISVTFDSVTNTFNGQIDKAKRSKYLMWYSLQMFFDNGGGPCWITSVGLYSEQGVIEEPLKKGLVEVEKINEVTLLLFPDSYNLESAVDYYDLHTKAIEQCANLKDRFVIMDVYHDKDNETPDGKTINWELDILGIPDTKKGLRTYLGDDDNLKYAAVYFPRIKSTLDYSYTDETKIAVANVEKAKTLAELRTANNRQYYQATNAITQIEMLLPASSAMAGIYARVDSARGVWKAPANVNITNVDEPEFLITDNDQQWLNIDDKSGKSVNVIRYFEGRGAAIVWGSRTLAGNSNEWRYIPVRRFFNMVEESVKNATNQFVFEPNDEHTWVRLKSMIANYLTQQWKAGALQGASVKEAFFVHIGLGETMTELDLWEGRLIVEIGMAVVRPAEFIILRFMHKMLAES